MQYIFIIVVILFYFIFFQYTYNDTRTRRVFLCPTLLTLRDAIGRAQVGLVSVRSKIRNDRTRFRLGDTALVHVKKIKRYLKFGFFIINPTWFSFGTI